LFILYSLIAGGVDTGWTFYTPYSTLFSNSYVAAAATGIFITGFSSIVSGVPGLAGFDQRGEHRPVLGAEVVAGKECVLAIERNGSH
jgi:hypothetical protein